MERRLCDYISFNDLGCCSSALAGEAVKRFLVSFWVFLTTVLSFSYYDVLLYRLTHRLLLNSFAPHYSPTFQLVLAESRDVLCFSSPHEKKKKKKERERERETALLLCIVVPFITPHLLWEMFVGTLYFALVQCGSPAQINSTTTYVVCLLPVAFTVTLTFFSFFFFLPCAYLHQHNHSIVKVVLLLFPFPSAYLWDAMVPWTRYALPAISKLQGCCDVCSLFLPLCICW